MKTILLSLLVTFIVACGASEDIPMAESITAVKAKHASELMAKPGIVSVGIGQDADGQAIIIIGVDSKDRLDSLALPKKLGGYAVKAEVIGVVRGL
jgi:hypothetical protein